MGGWSRSYWRELMENAHGTAKPSHGGRAARRPAVEMVLARWRGAYRPSCVSWVWAPKANRCRFLVGWCHVEQLEHCLAERVTDQEVALGIAEPMVAVADVRRHLGGAGKLAGSDEGGAWDLR